MDKKKTGNLIKEARAKKNYTQSELGDLLGVSILMLQMMKFQLRGMQFMKLDTWLKTMILME